MQQASTILKSKELSDEFSAAVLKDLEQRVRGERVYVGTAIDFGKAPYLFNKDNDTSFFVKLNTQAGERVVWGKQLEQAISGGDIKRGQDIVLSNPGKKDVVVQEKVYNSQGLQTGVRGKPATLNEWKATPLDKFTDRAVIPATAPMQSLDAAIIPKKELQAPSRER